MCVRQGEQREWWWRQWWERRAWSQAGQAHSNAHTDAFRALKEGGIRRQRKNACQKEYANAVVFCHTFSLLELRGASSQESKMVIEL